LSETLGQRTSEEFDLQACVVDDAIVRSIHSDRYRRVWNVDVLDVVRDVAGDFAPPEKGFNGATGLYAGEQDMFAFLIDPTGWVEVYGEQFAPGFFVVNSEVGRRSVGVSTFWYQRICANHIVWDAIEVVEVQKTHTARASATLETIRSALAALIEKRDARRDGFARSVQLAMDTPYGDDAEEAETQLVKAGFTRAIAKKATENCRREGRITLWGVIDGLTKLNREYAFAGARLESDTKAASLLALAA